MKRYIKYNILGLVMVLFTTIAMAQTTPPTIITLGATEIQGDSVKLRGYVKKNTGGGMIMGKGFAFKKVIDNNYSYVTVNMADTFSYVLKNLPYNTQYVFKTIAVVIDSMYEGPELSFTTANPIITPVVSTSSATSISQTTAIINGSLVLMGNPAPTELGFIFGTTPNINMSSTKYTLTIDSARAYYKALNGLTSATTYYYKMYVINPNGTILGDISSFTTPAPNVVLPTLTTFDPISITEDSATIIGKIISQGQNVTITSKGFEYKMSSQSNYTDVPISSIGDSMSYVLSGLSASTAYRFRPYVQTTTNGRVYGEEKSFTTMQIPPEFITYAATNVTTNSAKLNGKIFKSDLLIQIYGFYFKEQGGSYGLFDISQNINLDTTTTIFYNMTELKPYTLYTYKTFGLGINNSYEGGEISFRTNSIPMSVTSSSATNISVSSAKLNAKLVNTGAPKVSEKGLLLSSNSNFDVNTSGINKYIVAGDTAGNYSYTVSSLSSNTNYYFRAYAINQLDTIYGSIQTFKTLIPLEITPTITALTPDSITNNSAKLKASIAYGYTPSLTDIGFEYKADDDINFVVVNLNISQLNDMYYNLSALTANTTYQFKAFAINSNGTKTYSEEVEFVTLPVPMTLFTHQPSEITLTSAKLNGEVNSGSELVFFRGFEWRAESEFEYEKIFINTQDPMFNYLLSELTPNTNYYFRTFSKTKNGYFYGDSVQFSTLNYTPTTVSNVTISNIDTNSATFSGSIVEGTVALDVKSFIIKKWGDELFTSYPFEGSSFNITLDTLLEGTTYYVGIYALNSQGVIVSQIGQFRTLGLHNVSLSEVDNEKINISIYPNPAVNDVIITIGNNSDKINMIVSDVLGRVFDTKLLTKNTLIYNVNKLSRGIYTLTFVGENIKQTKKLIVK